MSDARLKGNKCPVCGKRLDAATSIEGDYEPSTGDISICIHCTAILIYNEDMSVSKCPQCIIDTFDEETSNVIEATIKVMTEMMKDAKLEDKTT